MDAKRKPLKGAETSPMVGSSHDTGLQITAHKDGFLIQGEIPQRHAGLKDFAVWDEAQGAWYISRRRAYEYDHHYGLSLFPK